MALQVEDLEDQSKYRQILAVPYSDLTGFVLDYIRKRSEIMVLFWSLCLVFLGIAITVRIDIAGYIPLKNIVLHSILGLIILPLLSVPVHEFLHVIPFYLAGARNIRVGMDIKQYWHYG